MDIPVVALAFIAGFYTVVVLVPYTLLAYLCGKYWRRTQVIPTSTQPAQIHFALKEGQTILGVRDMTQAVCFYIGTDVMDEKNYE
jgi:hypothetical protein